MTKKKIYAWMNKQIKAAEIRCTPLDETDPFNVCIAGSEEAVHIYGIDNLCKELDIQWDVAPHDDEYDAHYFMYKGHKFFGLVSKEKTDEGE